MYIKIYNIIHVCIIFYIIALSYLCIIFYHIFIIFVQVEVLDVTLRIDDDIAYKYESRAQCECHCECHCECLCECLRDGVTKRGDTASGAINSTRCAFSQRHSQRHLQRHSQRHSHGVIAN